MLASNFNPMDRILFDAAFEGILLLKDGRITAVNHSFTKWTGYTREEIIGQPADRWIVAEGNEDACGLMTIDSVSIVGITTKEGKQISARMKPVESADIPCDEQWLLFNDMSLEKQLEQEMLKHRHLEAIAALSGGIAHDYNNILTAIMGNLSLTLTDIPQSSSMRRPLEMAQEAAMIAKDLTRRLITFSKGGDPIKETAHIAPLIENAVRFALSGSGCIASFDFPDELWLVDMDQSQIGQAIHNVVINAREAMDESGVVTVSAVNTVIPDPRHHLTVGRYVSILVRDEGKGIPEELLGRIFNPYFSTKEMGEQKGMGLGLSISNSIVIKHSGCINVSSENGTGTSVEILLPASEHSHPTKGHRKDTEETMDLTGNGTVLVMDDESMILDIAEKMLERLGYCTSLAATGEEAVSLYRDSVEKGQPFDAVILDLTVKGGMGGMEALLKLKELHPEVKAIVSSGYSEDPVVVDYEQHGFSGVVAKPYRIQEMGSQLKSLIRGMGAST